MSSMRDILRDEFEPVLEVRTKAEPQPVPVPESECDSNSDCVSESDPDPNVTPVIKEAPSTVFKNEIGKRLDWSYNSGFTNFILGLYIALLLPKLSWGVLAVTGSIPTYIVVTNPDVFTLTAGNFQTTDWRGLLSILATCAFTQGVAEYCFVKMLQ
jgi:hypothetical protein